MAEPMKGAAAVTELKKTIALGLSRLEYEPVLATVRVGDKPDSVSYEKSIIKYMSNQKICCKSFALPEDIEKGKFLSFIGGLNNDPSIHGILLFRPLPKELSGPELDFLISPQKDVDGSNPLNTGKLAFGDKSAFAPCTAQAVMEILEAYGVNLEGKNAVIIGRSIVVGKPLAFLMLNKNATVTVCHSKTKNIAEICAKADILVAALGREGFVTADFVKDGAIVIDVGINVDKNGNIKGDVNFQEAQKASYVTPVPGGVGGVTNAVLALNVIRAARAAK